MTGIWVPKAKIIEPRRAIILPTRLQGYFKLEAVRPDGRRRLLADWFPNLITDAGLNVMGTSPNWLLFCRVGTGSTAPANADTDLQTPIASTGTITSTSASAQSSPPYYGRRLITYRFATGVAAGNLAEIGIASAGSGPTLFSRALILDASGNPTTITVLSDEVLDATYDLRQIVPTADVNDVETIGGIDYDTVARAASATSSTNWAPTSSTGGVHNACSVHSGTIGAITALPAGSNESSSDVTLASYSNNSLQRDGTCVWGLSLANFGGAGVRAASFTCGSTSFLGAYQISFANGDSPSLGIPKTSSQILTLVFRHAWTRGTP